MTTHSTHLDSYLTPEEVAEHLDYSVTHLKQLVKHSDGPAFEIINGKTRYTWNAVIEYESQNEHIKDILRP